ncbi:preprotein translocase subunit YajC [Synergistaceae bacterium OttesenSCG-928-I11]|nr:preprotein translocase subunit YajC [Synergistaceae bacterium OttesenSCG-928-I11]
MQQQQGGVMGLMFPIVLFVLIFYFLIFRPQKKKQQQHDKMINSIGRGDTVVTAGGFFGKVSDILEDSYIIEVADGVKVRILKSSISIRRDGPDAGAKAVDRPRKRRRKKRPDETGEESGALENGATEGDVEVAEETVGAAESKGVTPEENEALIESAAAAEETAPASQIEEATEEKKGE